MNRRLLIAAAAATAALSALPAHATTSWNLSAEQPDANYLTQNVRQFADEVKAATNGALEFKVQSNSVLLKRPEVKRGVQAGIVPPQVLMRRVSGQIAAQVVSDPTASPFYQPFKRFPDAVPAAEQGLVGDEDVPAVGDHVAGVGGDGVAARLQHLDHLVVQSVDPQG